MASDSGSGQASVAQIKKVLYKAVEDHLIRAELADDDGPYLACEYEAVARRIAALASAPAVERAGVAAPQAEPWLPRILQEASDHESLRKFVDEMKPDEVKRALINLSIDAQSYSRAGVLEEAAQLFETHEYGCSARVHGTCNCHALMPAVAAKIRALAHQPAVSAAPASEPICVCGHKRSDHEEEQPYECTAAMRAAVRKLLSKLDQVDNDTAGIFELAHIHGQGYKGANWREEYDAVFALLSEGEKGRA
jgi:hypothetical protein